MQDIVVLAIAVSAAGAMLVHIRALLRSQSGGADWFGILAITALVFGGLLYEANVLPRGQSVQFAIFGIIAATVGLASARSIRLRGGNDVSFGLAIFLPGIISGLMFFTNAIANPQLPLEQSLGRLLAVAILLLVGLGVPIFNVQIGDMFRVILVSILAMLVIAPLNTNIWRPCDIFKCGPFGAIYTGPFSSENALAIFSSVGILCALGLKSGKSAFWGSLPLALTLYATESRTSQLALGAALAAWLISFAWRRAVGGSLSLRPQAVAYAVAAIAITGISFYLMLNAEASSFSNRGNIWIRGLAALGSDWWRGLGLDRWSYLQSAGILPLLFPHNQNLLLLFGGGLLSVGLFLLMLVTAIRRGSRNERRIGFSVAYVLFLSVLGITEAYWNPIALDGHTFLVLPLVFLMSGKQPRANELMTRVPQGGPARATVILK